MLKEQKNGIFFSSVLGYLHKKTGLMVFENRHAHHSVEIQGQSAKMSTLFILINRRFIWSTVKLLASL
jgi:hypothetical protein